MKKNNYRVSAILAAIMLLCAVLFAGCVAETDQEISAGGSGGSLTISIKSGDFDLPVTRATTRALTTNPTTETENVIEAASTVIAIFDNDENLIKAQVPELVGGNLQLSGTQSGTNWLENANTGSVYVAANLPEAMISTLINLAPGTTKTQFATAFSLSMSGALNVYSLAGTKIPMFGKANITNPSTGNYEASVQVDHMLTKVTLNSLGVDFSQSTTPNAIFQPEQVFLVNVPDNIGINNDGSAFTQTAPTNWYFGEVAGSTGGGGASSTGDTHDVPNYSGTYNSGNYVANQFNAEPNLGTAALTGQTQMKAESPVWLSNAAAGSQTAQQYFFYTMPNLSGSAYELKTRLIIRGSFKENSSAAATEVYYAVPLANNAGNTDALNANKNYKVDVIIKKKGATDAFAALPEDITSTLDITFNVSGFNNQTTVVGVGRNVAGTAKVGDYFYSDGTWSSVYNTNGGTRQLVGLVFSTTVSDDDRDAGFTHGYVMALTDAGYDYNGGTPTKTKYKYRDYTAPTSGSKEPGLFNIGTTATQYSNDAGYWAAVKADLDGLDHTTTLLAASESEYQAAKAAHDYAVTVPTDGEHKTSGWYLPSIGQLYALAYNFGGRTAWQGIPFYNNVKGNQGAYNEYHICHFSGGADVTTSAINAFLTARLVTAAGLTEGANYQPFIDRNSEPSRFFAYLSSSDYSAYFALFMFFNENGGLNFDVANKASQYYVRPVLAF